MYSNELNNDDIKVIEQMVNLKVLIVGANDITDYSFISKLPHLTNGSLGVVGWSQSHPSESSCEIDIIYFNNSSTFVIKNDVKDENGNYVAPLEDDWYTYNQETQEIIVLIDKLTYSSEYLKYEFIAKSANGDEYYIEHSKRLSHNWARTIPDVTSFVESTATIKVDYMYYSIPKVEYQWYKNGVMIEGATDRNLVIKGVKLEDAGKYTVVIKTNSMMVTSNEVLLTVKDYKELLATIELLDYSEDKIYFKGDTIKCKITANNGSGNYKNYQYSMYTRNGSTGKTTIASASGDIFEVEIESYGNAEIYVELYDSDGNKTRTNVVSFYVYDEIVGNLKIQGLTGGNSAVVGDSLRLKITSQGGTGGHTYKYVKENVETGKKQIIKDYSTSTSVAEKVTTQGTTKYIVYVKDPSGREVESNSVIVYSYDHLLTLDYSAEDVIKNLGEQFILSVRSCSNDTYTYKFVFENIKTGYETVISDYNDIKRRTCSFSSKGNRKATVYVKDSKGNISKSNSIIIKIYEKPLELSTEISGPFGDNVLYKGDTIVYNVNAEGGSGEYLYTFGYKKYGYSYFEESSNSNVYKKIMNSTGEYQLYTKVTDSDGNIMEYDFITVTVLDIKRPMTYLQIEGVKIVDSDSSTKLFGQLGNYITLKASAINGSGDFTYKYEVENVATGEKQVLKDYSTATTFITKPTSAGVLRYTVYAKDSNGCIVESDTITVNVCEKLDAKCIVNGTGDNIISYVGEKVKLSATAEGGYGDYTYSYIVYNKDTKKWARLADNIKSNTFTWKAKSAGNRIFYVDVKDSTGKIVRSTKLNVSVK